MTKNDAPLSSAAALAPWRVLSTTGCAIGCIPRYQGEQQNEAVSDEEHGIIIIGVIIGAGAMQRNSFRSVSCVSLCIPVSPHKKQQHTKDNNNNKKQASISVTSASIARKAMCFSLSTAAANANSLPDAHAAARA